VIDPILQATYLGGRGDDQVNAIAIHPTTGEVYVAGQTRSYNDFPNTNGGAQERFGSAFVARLNKDLTQILQSTYLGGSGGDKATAIAIHPTTGEVYVAGVTQSKNFPKTSGGAQEYHRGGFFDAFVARLNSDLTQILQSTYLGGGEEDVANALAIHPTTGEIYVAGVTTSARLPGSDNGAQRSISSFRIPDAFVARLNKDLTQILQSTFLGGSDIDWATAIAIHPTTGEVYVAGRTKSRSFPGTTVGAQEAHAGGDYDAFVARLNSNLTRLIQSTYLGGNGNDQANTLAIHPTTGEIYVAGDTESSNFPGTNGGAQTTHGGGRQDAFVARLNKELTQILQSTYLGGSDQDSIHALAIHPTTGEIYVVGGTYSTNFPNTTGGAQISNGGDSDAFVARLNQGLTRILQSTYLGGSDEDVVLTIAIHPQTGDVYVAGKTKSTNFPNTAGGAQASNRGVTDAFVTRLSADLAASRKSSDGGGYYTTGSLSSMASAWNILLLLSVPAFVVARRIRKR
jgi:cell division protein FtsI/penicillin-binding protein 2